MRCGAFIAWATLVALPLASAEEVRISGKTTNLAGAGLAGAHVSVIAADTEAVVAFTSSAPDGSYEFRDLKPAKYFVFAEFSGFLPSARIIVDLSATLRAVANLTLVPQTIADGAPPNAASGLRAAGIRGSIDAGGYSAAARAVRRAGIVQELARVDGVAIPCLQDPVRFSEVLMPEVRRNPQALKPRLALGVAQFLAGRENEAIDTLMQAVELAPDDSLPYFLLAEAATQSAPRILEIRAKLKRFVGLNPADAAAHFHYAQTLQGDAEAELRAAIALKPDFARAHSTLAVLLEERGDDESAIAAYKESLRLVPDASDVLYRLAQAYKRIGQTEQSRQTLASFLKQREREQSEADRHRADMLQLLPAPCAP